MDTQLRAMRMALQLVEATFLGHTIEPCDVLPSASVVMNELRLAIEDAENTGIVLSITPDWVDDNGFDGDWVREHGVIQDVANEYWNGIGSGLALYDPAEDMLEHFGVPRKGEK